MNKYNRNIITIIFIVLFSSMFFTFWLDLNFGYGQIFLIITGAYGIYLNIKAKIKERKYQM